MTRMPDSIAAMRADNVINATQLLFFDFVGQPTFIHTGFGDVTTNDGSVWRGIGDVVSFDAITQVQGTIANGLKVRLALTSGNASDPVINKVLQSKSLVKGRRFALSLQFLSKSWQVLDLPQTKFVGFMDQMELNYTATRREVVLSVEGPLVGRRIPRPSNFDDTDQKAQFPGDRAFEQKAGLANKNTRWPYL